MYEVLQIIWCIALGLQISVFAGYYVYMKKVCESSGKNTKDREDRNISEIPSISFFVPTYNEEANITEKLSNTLSLHYSREKLRIFVVDDASTDRTIPLVEEFNRTCPECKIQLIKKKERRGKTDTLNMIANLNNETDLVCISDADIKLDEEALIEVARRFDDTTIGAACGREVVCNEKNNVAIRTEKTYRDLYITLRVGESLLHSTPIFEAGIMAIRSSLLKPIKSSSGADDTMLAVNVVKSGYRAVEEPKALFFEHVPETFIGRWNEKARRGKHLAQIFIENKSMLFNKKYGKFSMLILPVEAYMHIISPFLCILLILLAPFSFLNIVTLLILIGLALSMASARLRVTVLSFLSSQLALAAGLLSLARGKKDIFY